MGFRSRIFTVLAMVGVVPAAVMGWLSFTVNRGELVRTVGTAQAQVAAELARSCERFVAQGVQSLTQSMSVLPLEKLSDAELATALRIPYRQLEFVDALQILPGPAVWESGNGRPAPELDLLRERAPVRLAAEAGMAIGSPYAGAGGSMRLPIALRLSAGRVLAAELSLRQLSGQMQQASSGESVAYLATREGTVLAQPAPAPLTGSERALLRDRGVAMVQRADGESWLSAAAPVRTLGWTVVVAQPESAALRPAELVRRYTLFWVAVSLLLVAVLGALLSRHVTEPVQKLREGVQALREGRARKLEVQGPREIGELSRAFGEMAGEIVRRDEEIRRWNGELQARVEERTAELRAAQEQMLRTRRLAALGTLGAGVAHELNNPLTAICGTAGLLRKDLAGTRHEEEARVLQEQARRVSKIVSDLRAFADQERDGAGKKFPLAASVMAALDLYEGQMRARGIRLCTELTTCDAQGDAAQMQQAVAHLVANAITAMPAGGTLKVTLSELDGAALRLSVSDTGKGISPALRERIFDPFFTTKENPEGVGLGLSISHSIVEAHHGKLAVESSEGHGATFTIVLPAAAGAAHLR
jgi:two-component system NtrC family sensor kinase